MLKRHGWQILALVAVLNSSVAIAQQPPARPEQVAEPGGQLPGNPSLGLTKIVEGLVDPINLTHAGDGSGRLFVVERAGRIRIVTRDGELRTEPFLDLTRHRPSVINPSGNVVQSGFIEQGLYSVAFHPNFRRNGLFFVHFASLEQNGAGVVLRFKVDPRNPDLVSPLRARETEKLVLKVEQPSYNNNGGQIAFGPDGYLYAGFGDGGWKAPENVSQDMSSRLGKILRIDVDTDEPFSVPDDNPFLKDGTSTRSEIWAIGLHNPYKFSFDRLTGNLFVADVGDSSWEEINFIPASSKGGHNFGWPVMEGKNCYNPTGKKLSDCQTIGQLPTAQYAHPEKGKTSGALNCASVQGLGVANYGQMKGVYLVGDWCSGVISGLGWNGNSWQLQKLLETPLNITAGGLDEDGRVMVLSAKFYSDDPDPKKPPFGTLWRLDPK
ncbi:MAG: PQQ-dependent sugar dehydrogenase [Hyphomicrobiaceae bacterium]